MSEVKPRSLVDEYLAEKEVDGKIREPNTLYTTELTKECLRNSYRNIIIDTPPDAKSLRVFSSGDTIEDFYVNKVLRNTKDIKVIGTQLPARYIDPVENFKLHGRIDVLCQHDDNKIVIHEVKSIKNFYYLNDAKPDHKLQLQFYLGCSGIEYGSIDYLSKENMLQGLDIVDRSFIVKRDPDAYENMINRGRILYRAWMDKSPPEPCPGWLCNGW